MCLCVCDIYDDLDHLRFKCNRVFGHVSRDRFQLLSLVYGPLLLAQLCQFESHTHTHTRRAYVIMMVFKVDASFAWSQTHTRSTA